MPALRPRIRVRARGRIVTPKRLRAALGLRESSILEASTHRGRLILEVLAR